MLADYTIDQINRAFVLYAKNNDDIPAPANIIKLIETPPTANYDAIVCTCGIHYGQGIYTPEKRAKSYAWHRRTEINYTPEMHRWLDSYEKSHGNIEDDFRKNS